MSYSRKHEDRAKSSHKYDSSEAPKREPYKRHGRKPNWKTQYEVCQ